MSIMVCRALMRVILSLEYRILTCLFVHWKFYNSASIHHILLSRTSRGPE